MEAENGLAVPGGHSGLGACLAGVEFLAPSLSCFLAELHSPGIGMSRNGASNSKKAPLWSHECFHSMAFEYWGSQLGRRYDLKEKPLHSSLKSLETVWKLLFYVQEAWQMHFGQESSLLSVGFLWGESGPHSQFLGAFYILMHLIL